MGLIEYIKSLDHEGLAAFAASCATTVGQLRQVAYRNRRASASLAIAIDKNTSGSVPCEELRPDIDWGYLRRSSKNKAA